MRRAARASSLFSLAMSGGLLVITSVSMAYGSRDLLTLMAFVLSIFLLDGAVTRLRAAARAPSELGFSSEGLHIRAPRGDQTVPWTAITDIRFTSIAPRPNTLTVTLSTGQILQYQGVLSAIATESKLAWLEAGARAGALSRRLPRARVAGVAAHGAPAELVPTSGPQFWSPRVPEPAPVPGGTQTPPPPDEAAPGGRPEWGYTRGPGGSALPDPLYHAPPTSVRPFVWHFLPTAGTQLGAVFLVGLLVLAAIAVAYIAADALLSLGGPAPNAWIPNLIGLAAGAVLAAIAWRLARGELAGEVAGSVIFLPAYDRTKVELVSTLREAGAALDAGDAFEKKFRGRLIVLWRSKRTRATIVQASPETRAIVLRTVGRAHFEMHGQLKGAILERLRAPGNRK